MTVTDEFLSEKTRKCQSVAFILLGHSTWHPSTVRCYVKAGIIERTRFMDPVLRRKSRPIAWRGFKFSVRLFSNFNWRISFISDNFPFHFNQNGGKGNQKCCKEPVSPPEKKTRKSSADRGRGDRISGPPDRPVMICPFTGNAASDNLSLSPIYLFNSRQRCTQRLQSSFSHYSSNTCYFCYTWYIYHVCYIYYIYYNFYFCYIYYTCLTY